MKRRGEPESIAVDLLTIVRDLLQGGKHNRHTVARQTGRSVQTADRWLKAIETILGAKRTKVGKVAWIEIHGPMSKAPLRATESTRPEERQSVRSGGGVPRASRIVFDRTGGTPGGDWR